MGVSSIFAHLKLSLWLAISYAHPHMPHIRFFRFGIPWIMKRDTRTVSTEADALAMLNSTGLDLPIPRLIDTIRLSTETYTVMTRIKGVSLAHLIREKQISDLELHAIVNDLMHVLRQLWTLQQPLADSGKVMLSASGHGLPDPADDRESFDGPCSSILECYTGVSRHLSEREDGPWTPEALKKKYPQIVQDVTSDRIAWVAGDALRPHNVLVVDGRLSGIIDWEDSGWLPLHWQLYSLRVYCPGQPRILSNVWEEMKFPDETERAYKASRNLVQYMPV